MKKLGDLVPYAEAGGVGAAIGAGLGAIVAPNTKGGLAGGAILGAAAGVALEAGYQALVHALPKLPQLPQVSLPQLPKISLPSVSSIFPNPPPPNWTSPLVYAKIGQPVNANWQPQPWANYNPWNKVLNNPLSAYGASGLSVQWGSPPSGNWPGSLFSVPPSTKGSQTNLWGQKVCPRGTIYDPTTNSCVPGGQENF